MTLSVRDITNDLGVINITVWKWIKKGEIKATLVNRHVGWKIEEEDYKEFLDKHPKYRMMHDKELYNLNEIRAREAALLRISAAVISIKIAIKTEIHDERYVQGVERAITDIQSAINKEIRRKMPEKEVKNA